MTKSMFQDIVKRGFFSIKWLKNNGEVGHIKRGVIGEMGRRFTQVDKWMNTQITV